LIALISQPRQVRRVAQIVIRNLDDAIVAALRRRAAMAGTSMEEQARRALAQAVGLHREAALDRLDAIRRRIGRVDGESILADLRTDRRRDQP
jgi:plasmid stability protein